MKRQRLFFLSLPSFLLLTVVLQTQLTDYRDIIIDDGPSLQKNDTTAARVIEEDPRTTPKPIDTLVHFDPYFMGGFRNQHMRFVAFVHFAVQHNISQILLPSLRWSDHYNKPNSILHELIFDVPYWNSRAESLGLPLLVKYDPSILEGVVTNSSNSTNDIADDSNLTLSVEEVEVVPCWNASSSLFSGLDEAVLRNPKTNLRRTDIWNNIGKVERYSHCRRTPGAKGANNSDNIKEAAGLTSLNNVFRWTHLIPHGGLNGGTGRLWSDYNNMQGPRKKGTESIDGQNVDIYPEHGKVEMAVLELMRPSQPLRSAAEEAIYNAMQYATWIRYEGSGDALNSPPRLLALHPRVEQEMLVHRCSKFMEKNLSAVLESVRLFPPFHESNSTQQYRFDLVFVAVSKAQVKGQNKEALDHARVHGLLADVTNSSERPSIPIFESGTDTAAKVKFPKRSDNSMTSDVPDEGSPIIDTAESFGVPELVASIINFFTAVNADIFVGVRGSSYSTDVFSVRYYQHKEDTGRVENYIVGTEGIGRLYGPPPPHSCAGASTPRGRT